MNEDIAMCLFVRKHDDVMLYTVVGAEASIGSTNVIKTVTP